jgi:uncharacterized protein with GYD domain
MPKYLVQFSYSDAGLAAMIDNPVSRESAVRQVLERVGARLEHFYWMHGEFDGLAIFDAPDWLTVAGIDAAIKSTGFAHSRASQLFEATDIQQILGIAQQARASFTQPS